MNMAIDTQGLTHNGLPLPAAGTFMEEHGGFFVGVVLVDGARFGFVVSPQAEGESKGAWGEYGKDIDAKHLSDGLKNTQAMAAAGSDIAVLVLGLDIGGHKDWHIPARDQLELIYRNLKPGTDGNYCSFRDGENPSSVPPGFLYTAEFPARTDVEPFQLDGPQALSEAWYWSSTQYSAYSAFVQHFSDGAQDGDGKSSEYRVRAVRRFLID